MAKTKAEIETGVTDGLWEFAKALKADVSRPAPGTTLALLGMDDDYLNNPVRRWLQYNFFREFDKRLRRGKLTGPMSVNDVVKLCQKAAGFDV